MMARDVGALPAGPSGRLAIASLFDSFLEWSQQRHDPETDHFDRRLLPFFADAFGGRDTR